MEVHVDDMDNIREINPFLVEMVLLNICDFLSWKELKSARAVCSYWNQLATRQLIKKSPPIVFSSETDCSRGKYLGHSVQEMQDFTKIIESSNFRLGNIVLETALLRFEDKRKIVDEFFRVSGASLYSLTIFEGTKHTGDALCIDYSKKWNFPVLRTLHVHLFGYCDRKGFFQFVQGIIDASPNLKKFKISMGEDVFGVGDRTATELVSMFTRSPTIHNLQALTLKINLENSHLISLSELKNLKLQHVSVWMGKYAVAGEALSQFFSSQRTSLKSLKIMHVAGANHELTIDLPIMPQLQKLTIDTKEIEYPNISLTKQFPKLEKLKIIHWGYCNDVRDFLGATLEPTRTVTELSLLDFCPIQVCPIRETLLVAAKLFPALKTLLISVNLEVLEAVCEVMTGIEELGIYIDSDNVDHDRIIAEHFDPNIINLKKLRKLRLINSGQPEGGWKEAAIADKFVDKIRRIPNLEILDLDDLPHLISNDMMAQLNETLIVLRADNPFTLPPCRPC